MDQAAKDRLTERFNSNFIYTVNIHNVDKVFNIIEGGHYMIMSNCGILKYTNKIDEENYTDIEINMDGMMDYIKNKCINIINLRDILGYIYIIIIFKKSHGKTWEYLQELYKFLENEMNCGIKLKKSVEEINGEMFNVIKLEDGYEYIWKKDELELSDVTLSDLEDLEEEIKQDKQKNIIINNNNINKKDKKLNINNIKETIKKAAWKGYLNKIKWFYNKSLKGDVKFEYDETAIKCAAENGHLNIIEWFYEKSKSENLKFNYDNSAIDYASYNGHLNIIEWFYKKWKTENLEFKYGKFAVTWAIIQNQENIVKWFYNKYITDNLEFKYHKDDENLNKELYIKYGIKINYNVFDKKDEKKEDLEKKIELMKEEMENMKIKIKNMEKSLSEQRTETDFMSVILLEKIEELKENGKTIVTKEEFNKIIIRILTEMLVIKENINKIEKINEIEYDTLSNMSL